MRTGFSWSRDPLYGEVLDRGDVAALWASLTLGAPMLLLGGFLVLPGSAGGYGLTAAELILAAGIGLVVGAGLVAAGAWLGAYVAVPGAILLRPGLGIWGSAAISAVYAGFLVAWAGFELGAAADVLTEVVARAGGPRSALVGWTLAVLGVAALSWVGFVVAVRVWIRRVALLLGLALTVYFLIHLGAGPLSPIERGGGSFVLAVDLVAGSAVLLFPLLPDVSRFAGAPGLAASVTGAAWAVPAGLLLVLGARTVAVTGGAEAVAPADLMLALTGRSTGAVLALALAAWVVTAELDQPFGYLQVAGSFVASLVARLTLRVVGLAGLVLAVLIGALADQQEFFELLVMMISVGLPVFAVVLADFYVLRARSVDSDALYDRSGSYGGLNWMGAAAALIGFAAFHAVTPVGPGGWEDLVGRIAGEPLSARVGAIPPGLVAFGISFLLYSGLGRWLVREEVSVSRIAGRF